ncbi:aminotransferase class I/II-fold pyridoxal phosphate-dependent enzyme [Sandaracinobacter neustonicus]|uniref:Aminotransferase class I/II-fold pyridoxal phosphate-dependent enzyme n=1 Tax=Sandaracinobacter neustonicus TaxID=1715348 RepID=A0A501XJ33_9SPHN|nr:histidinol-phosphate transaminase [Sandaracinobacter neustonicus]TPE60556.1 aminotransferase class I/II-fold pyridoxal phosphate-dependent enzyme [Sandaracinobacter neustonicus]
MTAAVSRRTLFGIGGGAATLALASAPVRAAAATSTSANPFPPPAELAFLARNENPYGPSPKALKALADMGSAGCYYSGRGEEKLIAMIAEAHGLTPDHVLMGSGSSEVLNCATMALSGGGHILTADLTFDPPVRYAEAKGAAVKRVPLAADMQIDLPAMQAAVGPDTKLVHVCNPNNPTGLLLPNAALRSFAAAVSPKAVVLIDEAYNELTSDPAAFSLIDRVRAGDNVIVARTFSKIYGLAGMRVGYALARPDIIAKMRPWSMNVGGNTGGLAAAIATYPDTAFLAYSKAKVVEAREMIEAAAKSAGLPALKSAGNFVFVKVPDAEAVRQRMEAKGIIIREPYGKWTEWSRVSCGKIEDVARYTAALPEVVRA